VLRANGTAVQVEPMKHVLKAPRTMRWNLHYDGLLSFFEFQFELAPLLNGSARVLACDFSAAAVDCARRAVDAAGASGGAAVALAVAAGAATGAGAGKTEAAAVGAAAAAGTAAGSAEAVDVGAARVNGAAGVAGAGAGAGSGSPLPISRRFRAFVCDPASDDLAAAVRHELAMGDAASAVAARSSGCGGVGMLDAVLLVFVLSAVETDA